MTKKKILIVTSEFPPQPGGIGSHSYYLALFLAKSGYGVTVIADQRDQRNTEEQHFDNTLPFLVQRVALRRMRFIMYVNRIRKTLQALKQTDYVIATGKFSLWNVAMCALIYKRSTMAVIHGTEVNFKSTILRKAIDTSLKRYDTIVAVSNYTKNLVTHLNKAVVVIPNGLDVTQWKAECSTLQIKGTPVITTVGRVSTRKGQLQVINSLPELIRAYPEIHYHCIGILGESEAFMSRAKLLNVAQHLTFHGPLHEKDLKDILADTDVFVMLSQEDHSGDLEGFGIAILEANAMGVPVIGSKGCGIEDAIKDGVTGFLIDSKNAEDFKHSIDLILKNRLLFQENSKIWAMEHDWSLIIREYIDLIS
ncbi:glycosyltransferase family 4 protein [Gelidibacter sp. F2691]|nr:glycosyltransferase family 4 protein [Gelidibacter sp. F2691]